MRTVLINFPLIVALGLSGCSGLIHHVEIQQGNVVTQEMVDALTPGMTKRQVQLVMGTPMIVDVFEQERWDYPYRFTPSDGAGVKHNVSLYFEDQKLARITGDFTPSEASDALDSGPALVSVNVPYQDRGRHGVLTRLWRFLTFRNRGDQI